MTDAPILDDPAEMPPPPAEKVFPAFAHWLFRRTISLRAAARILDINHETVRRWALPFGHPERREPDDEAKRRIDNWSCGEVPPESFTPPGEEPQP